MLLAAATLWACGRESDERRAAAQQEPPPTAASGAPIATVTFDRQDGTTVTMTVEVADTPELEQCGLMHRLSMDTDHGMLFVFNWIGSGPFWNRNTFIPLTLAWIGADRTIVDITDMDAVKPDDHPQMNTLYSPSAPYQYVIEANRDWFANHSVVIGDHVRLDDALATGSGNAAPICREKGYDG